MRLREVKVGMRVRVKKVIPADYETHVDIKELSKWLVGKKVKVTSVCKEARFFTVTVKIGKSEFDSFNHKELEEVKK